MADDDSLKNGPLLRAAVEFSASGLLMIDDAGLILLLNREVERIFGYPREELLGQSLEILVPERFRSHHGLLRATFRNRHDRPLGAARNLSGVRKDGTEIPVDIALTPVATEAGVFVLASIVDLTERDRAERALRESEERTRLILDHALDAVITMNADGRITGWNPQAERIFGWSPDEALGRLLSTTIVPPTHRDAHEAGLRKFLKTGEGPVLNRRVELTAWNRAGQEFPVELAITPIQVNGQIGFSAFVRDISERRQSEAAIAASEAQYRLLFDRNPNPMWVFDLSSLAFLTVNDAAVHHYGYSREEFLGMTITDIRPSEDAPSLQREISTPTHDILTPVVWRHRKKDGSLIDVEVSSQSLVFGGREAELVLAHDVTQRTRLENQFRQAQKMEAVGRLAGGIAHDFNNILSAILAHAELLRADLAEDDPRRADADAIIQSAERAAALTHQILAFSRHQLLLPRVFDLNEVVAGIDSMLRRIIGEDIDLEMRLSPDLGYVKSDPGQMGQVIMNLAVNARDAMSRGGRLTIETANVELDEHYTRDHSEILPGRYVMLGVSDTGCGMTKEQQAHIFEPFFTTKEQGKGTGLGLSTVYGIVKQSGGYVWVYSEPERGATFKIYLPQVEAAAEKVQPSLPSGKRTGGNETILLVEDDDAVRKAARRVLERSGYTVLEAGRAGAASEFCETFPESIHLIVTDIVMPEINGFDLAKALTRIRPTAKVLFMSGYTESSVVHRGDLTPGMAYLEKPFTTTLLVDKVREVLDRP